MDLNPTAKVGHVYCSAIFLFVCLLSTLFLQVQQNIQVAVTEYAKLKQQLEKNTVIIEVLGHLKEVQNNSKISHEFFSIIIHSNTIFSFSGIFSSVTICIIFMMTECF